MTATLTIRADGVVDDASPDALELLAVTLPELQALPQGAFSADPPDPAANDAFRTQWEAEGRPDIGGQATLKRLDGSMVRVRFAISESQDGRFVAVLDPIKAPVDAPPTLYTGGQVLALWRAAERQLDALAPGSPERAEVESEIERLRQLYQELFRR